MGVNEDLTEIGDGIQRYQNKANVIVDGMGKMIIRLLDVVAEYDPERAQVLGKECQMHYTVLQNYDGSE